MHLIFDCDMDGGSGNHTTTDEELLIGPNTEPSPNFEKSEY